MKKLLFILFVCFVYSAKSQVYQLMPQYGYQVLRMSFDSTLQIPTTCGAPTLKSVYNTKRGAIAFDSCNNRFYTYNPKTFTWSFLGSGGTTDTTSLSNRINQRIDSLKRSRDSIFARKNGVFVFQYKDSIGSGGGTGWNIIGNTTLTGNVTIATPYNISFLGTDENPKQFNVVADNINLDGSQLKISALSSVSDTTLYKPLSIDANNQVYKMQNWITGGGTSIDTTNKWVNNITRTIGKDSIIYYIGNTRYAIKDSVGTNPPASGYYLSISDSTTQDNPTANTPRAVKFNTTDLANGFSLNTQTAVFVGTINNGGAGAGTTLNVTSLTSGKIKVGMVLTGGSITAGTFISAFISGSGGIGTYEVSVSQLKTSATYTGTMTSQIVCANTGIYNLQFSSQMDKTDAGVDYVNFWLRKNGTDITASAGVISLQGNSPAYMMAAWNYVIQLVAGDTIELYWGSADINMSIRAESSQTTPLVHPAVQSTIFTITQQSGILAGTGITAIGTSGNQQTGSVQTLATGTSGTDFAISSSSNTQTFNLPTASATNRGALSTTDWSTFNGKIGASDTATMLSKYQRSITAVKYSDTASMLSPYVRNTPTIAYLSSDFNTSNTTATNTNLTIAVEANTAYRIMINGSASKATSSTGMKISIGAPTGTTIKANASLGQNAISTIVNSFITSVNSLGSTFANGVAVEVPFRVEGIIVTGSTAGSITLQAATVTSNAATIYANTLMTLTKAYAQ